MSTSCQSFEDLKGGEKHSLRSLGILKRLLCDSHVTRRYIPTSHCIGKLNRSYSYKLCVLGLIKIILLLRRHYHISIILLKSSCTFYYLSLSPHSGCVTQLTNMEIHFFPRSVSLSHCRRRHNCSHNTQPVDWRLVSKLGRETSPLESRWGLRIPPQWLSKGDVPGWQVERPVDQRPGLDLTAVLVTVEQRRGQVHPPNFVVDCSHLQTSSRARSQLTRDKVCSHVIVLSVSTTSVTG